MDNSNTYTPNIAIIGAGIAGCIAANIFASHGIKHTVFEKSRGTGGRLSYRRRTADDIEVHFDHGAQYVTAKDKAFHDYIGIARHGNHVQEWIAKASDTKNTARTKRRFVGAPGMSQIVKPLIKNSDIQLQTRITDIKKDGDVFTLTSEDSDGHKQDYGPFTHVFCTAPAEQAYALIGDHDPIFETLKTISYDPCWTLMVAFHDRLPFENDILTDADFKETSAQNQTNSQMIGWAARNNSKPDRAGSHDQWVIQSAPEWSHKTINDPKEEISEKLLSDFWTHTGLETHTPFHTDIHRWLYARVSKALDQDFVISQNSRIIFAGDGCLGPRVEYAFESGRNAALHLIKSLTHMA